jgi:hypothetical protein
MPPRSAEVRRPNASLPEAGTIAVAMAAQGNTGVPRELAGGNSLAAVYPGCSAARLYDATVRTVGELGFVVTERDDANGVLSFRPMGPTASWPIEQMTAAIHQQGDAARIIVGGQRTRGFRLEMANWHQAKSLALMFLERLAPVLNSTPEPAAPASRSTADRLAALTELRDRGFLTEEEFAVERARL